ncbi:hypothetical protein LSH36_32g02029 [Paralvinella palmiformis]|uniref:Uncharacterized protein n=1 Tax=Paralvinella palmiformis TaxID=53620 RepID=A0AAD9NE68_9ANNE|nr:hypothetical protein LSH36_32g02029 [Paralvinella palmiformis]
MMGGDPGFVQDFKFQQEGQMVAVYFHEDFYIGEVVRVLSEDNGEINFMEKAKQVIKGQEVFRWPSRTDQFCSKEDLHPCFTINILKRNRSVSAWFLKKSNEEQAKLLNLSAKKAPEARKRSAEEERSAVGKRKVILDKQRQKKLGEAEKKRQAIVTIMDQLQPHHGPCTTPEHVDALLASYGSRTNQKIAVQAEIKYNKHVLGLKSHLLKITGSLLQLIQNLMVSLEDEKWNTETKKDDSLEIEEDRHDISAGATMSRLFIRKTIFKLSAMSMTEMGSGGNTRGKPRSTSTRTKSRLYARTRSWHLLTQSQHKDGTKTAERSVSAWFLKKSNEEQAKLLNLSAKKAPEARKRSAEEEWSAVGKRKVILDKQRQKKLGEAEKKRQAIVTIMDQLQPHHGPCTTPEHVDALLASYGSRTNQKIAVQAELNKHVLGLKSHLLKITGSLLQLIQNLMVFLGGCEVEVRRFQLPPAPRHTRPGLIASHSESDMEQNVESDAEMESELEDEAGFVQDFKFQQEGQMVAVYFHEDFYIVCL